MLSVATMETIRGSVIGVTAVATIGLVVAVYRSASRVDYAGLGRADYAKAMLPWHRRVHPGGLLALGAYLVALGLTQMILVAPRLRGMPHRAHDWVVGLCAVMIALGVGETIAASLAIGRRRKDHATEQTS